MDKNDLEFKFENMPIKNHYGQHYIPKRDIDELYKMAVFLLNKREVEIDKLNLCLNSYEDDIIKLKKHLLHYEIMTRAEINKENK